MMETTKAVYRCPHCCAIPPAPHAADCPERAAPAIELEEFGAIGKPACQHKMTRAVDTNGQAPGGCRCMNCGEVLCQPATVREQALEEVVSWVRVSEAMPDDEITVLLAFADGEVWPGYKDGDTWRDLSAMPVGMERITHWMHMPAGPTAPASEAPTLARESI